MEIKKNHLIAFVLIVAIFWVYFTWDPSEGFEPTQWGDYHYYDNEDREYPVTPSIVSYDIGDYKFPKKSMLQPEINKRDIPVAQNVPSGQIKQSAAPENINQIGASIDEIMRQENELMKPIYEMRRQLQGGSSSQNFPEVNAQQRPDLTQDNMVQELHETKPELVFDLTETNSQYSQNMQPSEQINKSLMQGMEQKHMMEQKMEGTDEIPIYMPPKAYPKKIMKKEHKNEYYFPLAMLLIVLLIGFFQYTKNH
jgi:hypothetical protein